MNELGLNQEIIRQNTKINRLITHTDDLGELLTEKQNELKQVKRWNNKLGKANMKLRKALRAIV